MRRTAVILITLLAMGLACGGSAPDTTPTPEVSIFDSGRTAHGFFPSPPEATLESVLRLFKDLSADGDFVLIQQNTAWEDIVDGAEEESQVAYLNAVRAQLGPRTLFWVNTLLNDLNLESDAAEMARLGRDPQEVDGLGAFAFTGLLNFDGSPKPALEVWKEFRRSE